MPFNIVPVHTATGYYRWTTTVSAKKSRQAKKWSTRIALTFFLNNILLIFQKWCVQDAQDYIRNAKNYEYKRPICFQKVPKYNHFSKNYIFWLNPFKKFILENIFLNLLDESSSYIAKDECQSTKMFYLKALAHSRQSKTAFFQGFPKKQSKTLKNAVFDCLEV